MRLPVGARPRTCAPTGLQSPASTGAGGKVKFEPGGSAAVAKHEDKSEGDVQGDYEHDKTKDVKDVGGGKHDKDDQK